MLDVRSSRASAWCMLALAHVVLAPQAACSRKRIRRAHLDSAALATNAPRDQRRRSGSTFVALSRFPRSCPVENGVFSAQRSIRRAENVSRGGHLNSCATHGWTCGRATRPAYACGNHSFDDFSGNGWQQNRRGSAGLISPTASPPIGSHFPGSFTAHFAEMAPKDHGMAMMHCPPAKSLKNGAGLSPHAGSWYAENAAMHCDPIGSPHVHSVHSRLPSIRL